MEAKYRLYTEDDAEQLVKLFYNNRFYLGKTGKILDPQEFRDIQKRRGLLFAIVAEMEGEIIAHVGVYPAGCQRVATAREVFMDSFLIDKKYRTRLHSLFEMYARTLYHLYEFYPNVRVMFSEVNFVNKESMYLQRQFGGILLGDKEDMYGQLELINFSPALLYLGGPMVRKGRLTEVQTALPPTKKSNYTMVEPVTEGRYVEKKLTMFGEELKLSMDLVSENIAGASVISTGLSARVLPGGKTLVLENGSEQDMRIHIDFLDRECRMVEPEFGTILQGAVTRDLSLAAGATLEAEIPAGIRSAEISTDRSDFTFALPVVPEEKREEKIVSFGGSETFSLDAGIGTLQALKGKNLFKEQWPCLSVPYLTGWITPDRSKVMEVSGETPQGCTVTCVRDDYDVIREYRAEGDCMQVHTRVRLKDPVAVIEPLFHFVLDDVKGQVDFYAEGKLIHSKVCDYDRDVKTTIAEMLFLDLLQEPYSKVPLSSVTLDFEGDKWEVTADLPFTAFYQHNYLAVNYLPADPEKGCAGYGKNGGEIDFGTLTIRRV